MLGINFDLGEDIDLLRDAVWDFAKNEILPRAADIDRDGTVAVAGMADMGPVVIRRVIVITG